MSFLLKNNIHTSIAKTFYDDVLSQRNVYYYFLGRTQTWGINDLPPEIPDTFSEEADIRNHIIYMNKIGISDVCLVTERINWRANTVYDRYDANISPTNMSATGATNIKQAKFYVITDEMHVYKCINNNNGAMSTSKPSGTSYENIQLNDGYIWKFMYSVTPVLQYKFLTETHMPVVQALNKRYYEGFGIDSVTINKSGDGYSGNITTFAEVMGDGVGAEIKLSINPSSGSIANVIITNQGSGYTSGAIKITSMDGKGSGKYGHLTAVLIPNFIGGKLDTVTISDPGINYSTDSQTNIMVLGNGEGAVLYPVIEDGKLTDVIIESPGSGYTNVALYVQSLTGSGAEIGVSSTNGDILSIQSDVELLAVPGSIYVVDVVDAGNNYSYAKCEVSGDGNGLLVKPVLYNGRVIRFDIENPGINYTWCKIDIVGDGVGAQSKPIYSPIKGHGHNAVDELFADTISIYSTIKFNQNQPLLTNNDFRQFGIIKNPEYINKSNIFRDFSGSACYTIKVNNATSTFPDQELLVNNDLTKKFTVVGTNNIDQLLVQSFGGIPPTSGMILVDSSNSSLTYTVNQIELPTVNKLSGDLIFIDNRASIFQSSNQFISLRTNIKF